MYLGNCPVVKIKEGLWKCPQCGFTNKAKFRRNCSRVPGWQEALRNQVMSRLCDKYDLGIIDLQENVAQQRLDVCLGGCRYLVRDSCSRWGSACCAFEEWVIVVSKGKCEFWK